MMPRPSHFTRLSCVVAFAAAVFGCLHSVSGFSAPSSIRGLAKQRQSLACSTMDSRASFYPSSRRKITCLQESDTSYNKETEEISSNELPLSAQTTTETTTCWNPTLRKQMAATSSLGILETIYLTYDKLHSSDNSLVNSICSATGSSCNSVLNGPYASISVFEYDIPLSLLGVVAYTTVFALASFPLLFPDESTATNVNANNRIALLGMTTLMGTFSVYLVSLIIGVLHTSCLFCFISAGLSVSLAGMSWLGGMLPSIDEDESLSREVVVNLRKNGVITGASSFGVATLMALTLFLNVDDTALSMESFSASTSGNVNSGTLLASTEPISYENNIPPPITTKSSPAALSLATDLSSLNSKMYGAFWCSHCYDQKQSLGLQAMQSIPYVECDREGYNNQRELCRERDVPGYPTWEIGGELFPGERSLDELREIVDDVLSRKRGV